MTIFCAFLRHRKKNRRAVFYYARSWFSNKCGAFISPAHTLSPSSSLLILPTFFCRKHRSLLQLLVDRVHPVTPFPLGMCTDLFIYEQFRNIARVCVCVFFSFSCKRYLFLFLSIHRCEFFFHVVDYFLYFILYCITVIFCSGNRDVKLKLN